MFDSLPDKVDQFNILSWSVQSAEKHNILLYKEPFAFGFLVDKSKETESEQLNSKNIN